MCHSVQRYENNVISPTFLRLYSYFKLLPIASHDALAGDAARA